MKVNGIFRRESKINQIICAILINLPVLSYGASIGWMSPMTILLQSKDSPKGVPLTDAEISWMAAIPYFVCVPFDMLMAVMAEKVGRKITLLFISFASAASWILLISSFNIWALILARALVGVTMAGCYVTCPMYTKEISDDSIRGALGCLIILFHTTGNLFLYIIGDLLSYHTILWVCLTIPAVHVALFLFMPDSPSYLVKKGRIQDATKALVWLRCDSGDLKIQEELDVIRKEQRNDEVDKFALKTIFADKILSRAFQIAMIATLAREVCGAVPVLNFAGDIFKLATKDTGLVLSPNQQAMMLGAVQVVGSILASSVVEKLGRKMPLSDLAPMGPHGNHQVSNKKRSSKSVHPVQSCEPLLLLSSLVSGLSMCALGSWFLLRDLEISAPSWVPLLTLCVCIFCDSFGLQPISIVLVGEIFSFKYRATVMATTMACASLSDFLQLLFFKPLANAVGIHVSFFFFGVICLLMSAYVIIVIPETKGRRLEDIYKDLLKIKKSDVKENEATEI